MLIVKFLFQLSGLGSEKYVLKACLSPGKRVIPQLEDGYPGRRTLERKNKKLRSWEQRERDRERADWSGNTNRMGNDIGEKTRPFQHDHDQDLDGLQDESYEDEEAALCPNGRLLRLNVSATERGKPR